MERTKLKSKAALVLASVGAGAVLIPSTPAGATSDEPGTIPGYSTTYTTWVYGSGTHISGMAVEWDGGGAWQGANGYAVYSKASNGEPVGNALGTSPVFPLYVEDGVSTTGVSMNVTGVAGAPYCAFIYRKTSGNPVLLNGGTEFPPAYC